MGKALGVTFAVGAKTMGTVASAFGTIESRLESLKAKSKELTVYQAKAAALTTASAQLQEKKATYAANPTAALQRELDAAQRAFNTAEKSAAKYNITVANSAKVQAQTTAAIQKTEAALARQEKLQANQAKRQEMHGQILGVVGMASTVAAPVKLAMDFESAMADVRNVTKFDAPGFQQFSRDMLQLSTEIPMTVEGLAKIASTAGSSIAKEELLRFTKDAAVMSVAWDMAAEDVAGAMTGLRTTFHLGQDEVMSLADSVNHLTNNMDAKAGDIVDFATKVSKLSNSFTFTAEQIGALGATFTALKMPAKMASSATESLFMKLSQADRAGSGAKAAFYRLGLPAKKMAKMFKEDAQGALLQFLEAVKKSKNPTRDLVAIMGEGGADKIAALVGGLDEYKKALGLVADKTAYAGSLQDEYNGQAGTTARMLLRLRNAGERLGIIMGSSLLPAIATVAETMVALLEPVAKLAEEYPQVTTAVFGVMAALAGFKVVGFAGVYAATLFSDGLTKIKWALSIVRSGVTVVIPVFRALGMAMFANPIGLVVMGVVALAAGFYLLYQKSETARRIMDKIWEGMKTVASVVIDHIANRINMLVAAWKKVKGWFSSDDENESEITVTQAETQVQAAEAAQAVAEQPATVAALPATVAGGDEPATGFPAAVAGFDLAAGFDPAQFQAAMPAGAAGAASFALPPSLPQAAAPATKIEAPVTQQFNITLQGMPDKDFADRVVEAVKSRSGALEDILAKIIGNILARDKRLAYGG